MRRGIPSYPPPNTMKDNSAEKTKNYYGFFIGLVAAGSAALGCAGTIMFLKAATKEDQPRPVVSSQNEIEKIKLHAEQLKKKNDALTRAVWWLERELFSGSNEIQAGSQSIVNQPPSSNLSPKQWYTTHGYDIPTVIHQQQSPQEMRAKKSKTIERP